MNLWDDEYKEWLKTVKEGDEVAYDNSYSYQRTQNWKVAKVEKITPSGQYRLSNKDLITKDGKSKGHDQNYWIQPVTDHIREVIKRRGLLSQIQEAGWTLMPTDVLEHVVAWIKTGKEMNKNGGPTIS